MGKFIGYAGSINCKWKMSEEFYEKWKNHLIYKGTYCTIYGGIEQLDDYYDLKKMCDETTEEFVKELKKVERLSWVDDSTYEKFIEKQRQENDNKVGEKNDNS